MPGVGGGSHAAPGRHSSTLGVRRALCRRGARRRRAPTLPGGHSAGVVDADPGRPVHLHGECAPARCRIRRTSSPWPTPSTATGRRVVAPDGLFPDAVLAQAGSRAPPSATRSPVPTASPRSPRSSSSSPPRSLRARCPQTVATWSRSSTWRPAHGCRCASSVPVDAARHGAPDTIVMAWPRARFEFGHTYVARVTDGLRARTGGPAPRAAGGRAQLRPAGSRRCAPTWRGSRATAGTRCSPRPASPCAAPDNATAELDAMNAVDPVDGPPGAEPAGRPAAAGRPRLGGRQR